MIRLIKSVLMFPVYVLSVLSLLTSPVFWLVCIGICGWIIWNGL